jgi:hypothetical protein
VRFSADKIWIVVKDNGIGIPEDRIKDIFEPFSQGEKSTFSRFGGTGLGLSIVNQLVGEMHGEVWVENTFGSGAIFTVELPLSGAIGNTSFPSRPDKTVIALASDEHFSNLLEIYTLATGASWRGLSDKDAILEVAARATENNI